MISNYKAANLHYMIIYYEVAYFSCIIQTYSTMSRKKEQDILITSFDIELYNKYVINKNRTRYINN